MTIILEFNVKSFQTYFANSSRSGIKVIFTDLEANGHQNSILPACKNGLRHKIINMTINFMFIVILHSFITIADCTIYLSFICKHQIQVILYNVPTYDQEHHKMSMIKGICKKKKDFF